MKDRKILIITGSILLLLIVGTIFLLNNGKKKVTEPIIDELPEESIALTDNIINLKIGEKYQLDIQVNSSKNEDIIYLVNDETVATITKDGLLEAKGSGTAIISALTASGLTSNAELIVSDNNIVYLEKNIPIKSIEIDAKTITLASGQSYQIEYKILPDNATDKMIMWETNDARIATVNDSGLVFARQSGVVVLTVYSINGVQNSITVAVKDKEVNISDIELSPTSISLNVGESYQMGVIYIPSNVNDKTTTWSSSNPSVATVNNGLITANGVGSTIITATSNGITKSSSVVVTKEEIVEISSIKLSKTSLELSKGQTYLLSATYLPSDASNTNFIWSSSDTTVATISNKGLITTQKSGTTTIMVKSTNGKSAILTLTVKDGSSSSSGQEQTVRKPELILLNIENVTLKIGATKQLRATILPLNASQSVTWFTGDSNVVSVSNGLITAKKTGKTTVSALSTNGLVAKCTVTVRYPEISIETASNIPAPGSSISSEEVHQINSHLENYIEEMGEEAALNGQNETRAKVIAAAFFLAYNPYYQVSYNFSGKDSIGPGWFTKWGNATKDAQYPVKGIDCNAFIRWSFYQVLGRDIGSVGKTMRLSAGSVGLRVGDVAASAEPGDVLRKDKNLMGGVSGHVAFVYSVDRENGTVSIIHAGGSKIGVTITTYTNPNSRMNFNYLYDMNYIYGG